MAADLHVPATAGTVAWGAIDASRPAVRKVPPDTTLRIEAVTHHAGDAPDLLMDDQLAALWADIPETERGPGVHILTGPIEVEDAEPGMALAVDLLAMSPRLPYGSNCAANWGLLYDRIGTEHITIYGLDDAGTDVTGEFPPTARPLFGFDFTARERYDLPGVISAPDPDRRTPFRPGVHVPVRPHLGVMGVAPAEFGPRSSIPPGVFGGNVDNYRFGPGTRVYYPIFQPGAGFFVGDPHFGQGDGEMCGTAIEASLDVTLRLSLSSAAIVAPVLETATQWYTHGFGDDLDAAMRMAAEQALQLLVDNAGYTVDEAYSLCSVAVDLGITQVVDGTVGCHAAVPKSIAPNLIGC